ncbi:MAG: hypothetical protein NZL94_08090, partial [Meiothermus sp.]
QNSPPWKQGGEGFYGSFYGTWVRACPLRANQPDQAALVRLLVLVHPFQKAGDLLLELRDLLLGRDPHDTPIHGKVPVRGDVAKGYDVRPGDVRVLAGEGFGQAGCGLTDDE